MRKTITVCKIATCNAITILLMAFWLSGCATYDAKYPMCTVLPAGVAGCPSNQGGHD
ncbi:MULTISPECIES: hypothetical protein [Acidithiobacillus]|jgi:hypothetical protein|uniref:hypothetical protein n=1 Tax=Acidithiobacillus TaxID=119977 RepID=UPI001C075BA5|nr:hypothetical protein [Acidithiobacillus ferrooxidans]MBU2807127.1 hypothetical protein [Acidithiobacillus ferrooxidans F221]